MRYDSAELFFPDVFVEYFFEDSASFVLRQLFVVEVVRVYEECPLFS